jgi:hypothetical protein
MHTVPPTLRNAHTVPRPTLHNMNTVPPALRNMHTVPPTLHADSLEVDSTVSYI